MSNPTAHLAQNAESPTSNSGQSFKRAYQACINCRKRKIKCIIECNEQGQLQSTCTRCKRELRQCTFSADRRTQSEAQLYANSSNRTVQVSQGPLPEVDRGQSEMPSQDSSGTFSFTPATFNSNYPVNKEPNRTTKRPWSETDQSTTAHDSASTRTSNQGNEDQESFKNAESCPTGSSTQSTIGVPLHDNSNVNKPPNESIPQLPDLGTYIEPWYIMSHLLSHPSQETLDEWNQWRFVKLGFITAQEAVTYVDLFFQKMSILSPIIHDYYHNHSNHHDLIHRDPVLCCTIVALSARYHVLFGEGGLSRGYYIHDRLWKHCQSLFHRIVWDQRRAVRDQTRHLGTIESFLLVTEWHPRSAHLPADVDFWGSETGASDDEEPLCHNKVPNKWLQEVEETAQRSDRMSWMLLGGALTLAHELDLFDGKDDSPTEARNQWTTFTMSDYLLLRRNRLRRLLFVYISQLASRIGCALPKTPFHHNVSSAMSMPDTMLDRQWHDHMSSWIELSQLVRTSSEFLFPSKTVTRELLRSGRYSDFLDHFRPLLSQWLEKYTHISNTSVYHRLLVIDYQFVRLYINSLALQAVAGRMAKSQSLTMDSQFEKTQDSGFVREVINGSKQILEMVIKLAADDHLKYIPALALGVRRDELDQSLSLLDRAVESLRTHAVDDVHLGVRYASLLGNHIKGLRQRFVRVYNPITSPPFAFYDASFPSRESPTSNDIEFRTSGQQRQAATNFQRGSADMDFSEPYLSRQVEYGAVGVNGDGLAQNSMPGVQEKQLLSGRDWFALPFDASNNTFENTFMQNFFDIDAVDTSFFWNISL